MSLNSALFGCFEKKKFWVESQNITMNFSTFSVGGCWGQPMLLFWKLVDETQMVKPPEPTSHHNLRKYLILLPLRAIYFRSLYYETPCIYIFSFSRISDRILRAEKWREVQKSVTPMLDLETVRLVSEISENHLILLLVSEIMSFEQLVILFQILPILCLGTTKFFHSSATLT